MNKRLVSVLCFSFAALLVRADIVIQDVVNEAKKDIEKAPAVVAKAAVESPDDAIELVKASVTAIPEKVIQIVCAVCKGLPKMSPELVRTALDIYPDRSAEIVVGITDCVPAEVREALAAPAAVAAPVRPTVIPLPQPINPDVVSPSN